MRTSRKSNEFGLIAKIRPLAGPKPALAAQQKPARIMVTLTYENEDVASLPSFEKKGELR